MALVQFENQETPSCWERGRPVRTEREARKSRAIRFHDVREYCAPQALRTGLSALPALTRFTALIMADPVIRDFRTGIDPLIFSKPVSRAQYLLGKFFGNFFVLVCCQAAFVLTLFALQTVRKPGMIVQDVKVFPYLKHFLVFVAISHLVLAASIN